VIFKSNADAYVVIRGGRADLKSVVQHAKSKKLIGIGVFLEKESEAFSSILPGPAFTEKNGTIINYQGVEQQIQRAVIPKNSVKNDFRNIDAHSE
jgi:NADH dehydrogenase/NADH:ubiquinone oxidoreductase subunit G